MPVFSYKATPATGEVTRKRISGIIATAEGTIIADTARKARDLLRARGLMVIDVAPVDQPHGLRLSLGGAGRRYSTKSVSFIRELSTLLGVGIPLLEAIDTISRQHHGPFRGHLMMLRDRVSEGLSLAESMRQLSGSMDTNGRTNNAVTSAGIFDDLTISITDVGEQAGTLDAALAQLAEFRERSLQFQNRVASALLYPCFVLALGVGVAVFLMTYVVPNLLTTLIDSGQPLPLSTRIVKGISDMLVQYWWLIGASLLVIASTFSFIIRTDGGRRQWHCTLLKIPLIGDLLRKQTISRIAIVISTLMKSGIVFVRAVQIAQRSTQNVIIRHALVQCEHAVESGRDIAEALETTGAFPGLVIQIFSVGQQSGRLEEMLDRLAADYDRQVAVATGRLASVLEPVLIVSLALLVGLIAFATILPILEAGNAF